MGGPQTSSSHPSLLLVASSLSQGSHGCLNSLKMLEFQLSVFKVVKMLEFFVKCLKMLEICVKSNSINQIIEIK